MRLNCFLMKKWKRNFSVMPKELQRKNSAPNILNGEQDLILRYKACDLVLREFEKINGKFASIGLVKISFPVKEIYVAELKGE